ncbi:MAG: ATP-dependent endonuclease [Planctomycetes bacterium]|nr:ATP-dependent endonuclease [Planctomycetota bacterium]
MQSDVCAEEPADTLCRTGVKVLVVVEGINDIEFLRRISRILHANDDSLPDLEELETQGELVFLPVGGSELEKWIHRLGPLKIPEFHLYDRDTSPLTEEHQGAVDAINRRPGCIAALTGQRHLENYIHPEALRRVRGLHVSYGPEDDVAELVARRTYDLLGGTHPWQTIPSRKRRQMKHRAKRWLNTEVVDAITPALLAEQDPAGDVRSWLEAIQWLIDDRD